MKVACLAQKPMRLHNPASVLADPRYSAPSLPGPSGQDLAGMFVVATHCSRHGWFVKGDQGVSLACLRAVGSVETKYRLYSGSERTSRYKRAAVAAECSAVYDAVAPLNEV